MQKGCALFLYLVIGLSALTVLLCPWAAAETCAQWVAKMTSVQGTVEAQRMGDMQWQPAQLHDMYCPGDTLRVQERSRADLVLLNQSVLRLNENTTLTLEAVKEERTSWVNLLKGAAHFFSRGPRSLEVRTPSVVAAVRGTEFVIRVEETQAFLSIFEGTVLGFMPTFGDSRKRNIVYS
jgi:ferric-dicitrate binding protein FerR (iron transport regulator)